MIIDLWHNGLTSSIHGRTRLSDKHKHAQLHKYFVLITAIYNPEVSPAR